MKLLIDDVRNARLINIVTNAGADTRHYYINTTHRALIVCRNGLDLPELRGQVVDANIGWDPGTQGFTVEGNEGKRHTKITLYRILWGQTEDEQLSKIIRESPHNKER